MYRRAQSWSVALALQTTFEGSHSLQGVLVIPLEKGLKYSTQENIEQPFTFPTVSISKRSPVSSFLLARRTWKETEAAEEQFFGSCRSH